MLTLAMDQASHGRPLLGKLASGRRRPVMAGFSHDSTSHLVGLCLDHLFGAGMRRVDGSGLRPPSPIGDRLVWRPCLLAR
jgi:hypothetical protein